MDSALFDVTMSRTTSTLELKKTIEEKFDYSQMDEYNMSLCLGGFGTIFPNELYWHEIYHYAFVFLHKDVVTMYQKYVIIEYEREGCNKMF